MNNSKGHHLNRNLISHLKELHPHLLLNKNVKEKNNPFVNFWDRIVLKGFSFTFKHKKLSLIAAISFMAVALFSGKFLGTEFLPQLMVGITISNLVGFSFLPKKMEPNYGFGILNWNGFGQIKNFGRMIMAPIFSQRIITIG